MAVALDVEIRLLRPADAPQVADLLTEAFAEEFEASGAEPQAVLRMLRAEGWAQRGPWRRLASVLAGEFAFFVAAYRDRIVGCTAIAGRALPVISSVAVHPGLRRHGIAESLLRAAEGFAAGRGCDRVALDVLAHNTPALTLYLKTGYEEFHRYSTFTCESASAAGALPPAYRLERVRSRHACAFDAIERRSLPERFRAVAHTPRGRYTAGPPEPLERLLAGTCAWRRALLDGERVAGFLMARSAPGQRQGKVEYPLLPPDYTEALPGALADAARFIGRAGCRSARVDVSDERPDQQAAITAHGWTHTWTFLQMVKRLTRRSIIPVRPITTDGPADHGHP